MDIMCSSHFSIGNHVSYVTDHLYDDAARIIFSKITKYFDIKSNIASPHDTAILLDTTGSMGSIIFKFKNEAVRLATETFNKGGRIALFEYRDLDDPFEPVEHCSFETCTLGDFIKAIDSIEVSGGGDEPESLLSASLHTMRNLNWQRGATKSLVVLTDAGFLSPDRDGATYQQVVEMSRKIDPVNFYIITPDYNEGAYLELAKDTDGKVVTNFDELSLLTDYIIERADSLPKVEVEEIESIKPTLEVNEVMRVVTDTFKIKVSSSTGKILAILNDAILGVTTENEFTITDIDTSQTNILSLVPISDSERGDAVTITLDQPLSEPELELPILKAPNTGFKSEIML
ncbi:MAG: VWA domain-containing protein [Candidatus Saccharibacteria bacterium]|nr:VWA domain-containing protein [Candidatus Saccharibacteria bacterium]